MDANLNWPSHWVIIISVNYLSQFILVFEAICAYCTTGLYASLAVRLSTWAGPKSRSENFKNCVHINIPDPYPAAWSTYFMCDVTLHLYCTFCCVVFSWFSCGPLLHALLNNWFQVYANELCKSLISFWYPVKLLVVFQLLTKKVIILSWLCRVS